MTRKKPFKRWLVEVQQLLVNNTPISVEQVEDIDELTWFDDWADGLTPKDVVHG